MSTILTDSCSDLNAEDVYKRQALGMFGEPGADRGRISGGFEGLRYGCCARIHHGAGDARRGAERADVVLSLIHI